MGAAGVRQRRGRLGKGLWHRAPVPSGAACRWPVYPKPVLRPVTVSSRRRPLPRFTAHPCLRASSRPTGWCLGEGLGVKNNPFPEPKTSRNEVLLGFASWGCPGLYAMASSVPAGWDRTCSAQTPAPPQGRGRAQGWLAPSYNEGDEAKAPRRMQGCSRHQRGEKGMAARWAGTPSSRPPAGGVSVEPGRDGGRANGACRLGSRGRCQPRAPLSIPAQLTPALVGDLPSPG